MTLPTLPPPAAEREELLSRARELSSSLQTTLEGLFGSRHPFSDRLVTLLVALHHELDVLESPAADATPVADPASHVQSVAVPPTERLQRFVMDAQASCIGWHPAEIDGVGNAYRWSGPGVESFITIQVDRATAGLLSVHLVGVIEEDKLSGLRITIDGVAIPYERVPTDFGSALRVALEASPLSSTVPTEICLRVPRCASPASLGRGDDERKLGLAVSEITFLPI